MINKSDMLQDIERVLVSEEEIHARIKEVGAQIAEDYRGKCPVRAEIEGGQSPLAHAAEARGEAVHAPAERVGGQIFKCSVVNGVKHRF